MDNVLNIVPAPAETMKKDGIFKSENGLRIYSDKSNEIICIPSSIPFKNSNMCFEFALSEEDANLIIKYNESLNKDDTF